MSPVTTMSASLTPLEELIVLQYIIPAHGLTPNSSIQDKPLMIYKEAFRSITDPSEIELHLESIGEVVPQWHYTMYSTSHFHSTTHEVLGILHGRARLCFGHEENPSRIVETVQKGDVIVIPAGVAHRLLDDLDERFEMVGCYPRGKQWDMCYGRTGEESKVSNIKRVSWFSRDPVYGDNGPATEV